MSSVNTNTIPSASYMLVTDKPTLRASQAEYEDTKVSETAKPVIEISDTELQQAVDIVNQAVAIEQRSLSFSIDDISGRSVVKVIDDETDELIKQIPSEELLKVAQDIKRLQEEMGQSIGLLIDNKV